MQQQGLSRCAWSSAAFARHWSFFLRLMARPPLTTAHNACPASRTGRQLPRAPWRAQSFCAPGPCSEPTPTTQGFHAPCLVGGVPTGGHVLVPHPQLVVQYWNIFVRHHVLDYITRSTRHDGQFNAPLRRWVVQAFGTHVGASSSPTLRLFAPCSGCLHWH